MGVRLSDVYFEARRDIEEALESCNIISLKTYGSLKSIPCEIKHIHIEGVADVDSFANIDIIVTYKENVINKENKFESVTRVKNIKVLSSGYDTMWSYNMIHKIWSGDYPSSVAIDKETGVLFFFNVRPSGVELIEFGVLDSSQMDAFFDSWNDREPFRIMLDEKAMFNYIDGSEGYRNLRENVYVELNCIVKLRVYWSRKGVI